MSGHEFPSHFPESGDLDWSDTSTSITEANIAEMRTILDNYPQPRSAVMPMLHYVQSVDGRISPYGVKVTAELVGITEAQVNGVATFYTMYKRKPAGKQHVGVCVTGVCGILGGDFIMDACEKHLGIKEGETTADGAISLEAVECNAACDFAPVMMVNWEFMDNMTPDKAVELLDKLAADDEVHSTRGAKITSWKEAERVLAGFNDGRADEGPTSGEPSQRGLDIAKDNGWTIDNAPSYIAPAPAEEAK
ncbi:MAG: NADH-quinone oxidoreductase subunit NuoE [Propionibacteriaceae bacterium]